MIKQLNEYLTENTPFLRRVSHTGKEVNFKRGVGRYGFGPKIPVLADKEEQEQAEKIALEAEHRLVSSFIDSWIRGQLYLHACEHGFTPIEGCACKLVPQHEQIYPLRADAEGKPIDPMLVRNGCAVVSPAWTSAPKEFFFAVDTDQIHLSGTVTRAFRGDCWNFHIRLSMAIHNGAVCVEVRDRA